MIGHYDAALLSVVEILALDFKCECDDGFCREFYFDWSLLAAFAPEKGLRVTFFGLVEVIVVVNRAGSQDVSGDVLRLGFVAESNRHFHLFVEVDI